MKTHDVLDPDFKQKPVIIIKDEKKLQLMSNPNYYPILVSLREGFKTVKEIEEDFTKFIKKDLKKQGIADEKKIKEILEKKKRSDKSLYRYIQHLIDANFVALVGKRVAMEKSLTEKLFARTAKFFFVESYYEKMICSDQNCVESLSKLLGVIYEVPPVDEKLVEKFTIAMMKSSKEITSILFNEKSEKFVQMVDKLAIDEVTAVLSTLSLINLISNTEEYAKLIESLKNEA